MASHRFLILPFAAVIAALSFASAAKPPIAFRLDDVQCGWQQTDSMAIIDAFIRWDMPLSIALITAPPANFPGNYDCHVPDVQARMTGVPAGVTSNYKLELGSHSVHHIDLTTMNATMQQAELVNSKQHIDSVFNYNTTLFMPPDNKWDPLVTIPLMVAAGYTTISDQCTTGQTNGAAVDNMCVVDTLRTTNPKPYFQSISGIVHASIGVSTADFASGVLLSPSKLMGPETLCGTGTDQSCTINSQVTNMAQYMQPATAAFSVIMMHPQNFGGDGVTPQTAAINAYYDELLPQVRAKYDVYTISDMVIVAKGITKNKNDNTPRDNTTRQQQTAHRFHSPRPPTQSPAANSVPAMIFCVFSDGFSLFSSVSVRFRSASVSKAAQSPVIRMRRTRTLPRTSRHRPVPMLLRAPLQ
jgi:peptidoglycan/xylan/chitin deacetylase (PgdA/CDA1 family)